MAELLSFEQGPPISVPFRFFIAAPWYGVAAGLLLAWVGPDALASRWTPAALALTHLVAIGFMLQVMCGALLQFVPVAAGGNVWRPRLLAAVVQPMVGLGVALLAAGLFFGRSSLLTTAAAVLVTALAGYVGVVAVALLRTMAKSPAVGVLRGAIFGLLVTASLGGWLAAAFAGVVAPPTVDFVDLHAAWGLGGWSLLLLAGVSLHVVPMFQLTPPYPGWLGRWFPRAVLAVLGAWSVAAAQYQATGLELLQPGGLVLAALFGALTLRLQARRRRRGDTTLVAFRTAMISLIAIPLVWGLGRAVPRVAESAEVVVGALALVGVFVSAITGMLYKIVPFLNWFHLRAIVVPGTGVPSMRSMISEQAMRGQMAMHVASLALLLASVAVPGLARIAGLAFAVSCAWLGWNLAGAAGLYARLKGRIVAGASAHES